MYTVDCTRTACSDAQPSAPKLLCVTGAYTCRSNLSYGRYWEGRTQLQQMTSKLTDAVVMSLQFDRTAVPKSGATREQIEQHDWFRDTMVHLISLMHAVALATLRDDYDMENLVVRLPSCMVAVCCSVQHHQRRVGNAVDWFG